MLYEHRASSTGLARMEVIDSVIASVPRPPHTIKLKGASKTISVQVCFVLCCVALLAETNPANVAPLMFGQPLLNNVLIFDHVQLQKGSNCWVYCVLCQYLPLAKLCRCYGSASAEHKPG